MKTEAYICDHCSELKLPEEVVGVSLATDIFNTMESFAVNFKPEKEPVHLCTKCHNMHVVQPTERETNRKKDENGYILKLKEMSYMVRSQCVTNFNKKLQKNIRK